MFKLWLIPLLPFLGFLINGIFGKKLPKLVIKRKPDSIFDYQYEDFEITGYESHPHIKAPVAV